MITIKIYKIEFIYCMIVLNFTPSLRIKDINILTDSKYSFEFHIKKENHTKSQCKQILWPLYFINLHHFTGIARKLTARSTWYHTLMEWKLKSNLEISKFLFAISNFQLEDKILIIDGAWINWNLRYLYTANFLSKNLYIWYNNSLIIIQK